jgi:hypothetical protein
MPTILARAEADGAQAKPLAATTLLLLIVGAAVAGYALHAVTAPKSQGSVSPAAATTRGDANAQATKIVERQPSPAAQATLSPLSHHAVGRGQDQTIAAGVLPAQREAQLRAQVEAHIATLDERFAAERQDPAWATRGEAAIGAFFADDALRARGLIAPRDRQAACRSMTCRIRADFPDAQTAEMATQHLGMHLADALPYGAVMPRARADGRIEVNAWYSAKPIAL